MTQPNAQRVDRALLVGVDRYEYIAPQLHGCVSDVDALEQLLTERFKTPRHSIIKLTASHARSESPGQLATRGNIITAFGDLAAAARPGEQVYVHFSGHGMRNDTTILPGYEPDGRDEAIAPTDSGYQDPAAFYILDKELGVLIRRITDKGAFVTVVLDCCHSASGTRMPETVLVRKGQRKPEDRTRGRAWEGGDPRPRPDSTLVAPLAELKAAITGPGESGTSVSAPKNYVLLTACRERETAKEYGTHGLFTHYLLELLRQDRAPLTYRGVQDYIASSITRLALSNKAYSEQTPQLEGNGNLIIFGGGTVAATQAMTAALQPDGTVVLSGGAAVGISVGSTVALYPFGVTDLADPGQQLAVATVTDVRPDASVARLEGSPHLGAFQPGMRAVVVRPGSATVQRRVAVGTGPGLDELREAVARGGRDGRGSTYIQVVDPGDGEELSVTVAGGQYSIRDQHDRPLPRVTPPLPVANAASAGRTAQRLEHIIQFRNAWMLHNGDETSRLRGLLAVSVEIIGSPVRSAGRVNLRPGDRVRIKVHNRSARPLSAALFYFAPNWSVQRIWPAGVAYTELAPTSEDGFVAFGAMDVFLPEGVTESLERLKLFATEKPTSFDVLAMDSLDVAGSGTRSVGGNALENLLSDIAAGTATRQLLCRPGTGDWTTGELELEVQN
jgi:hypothetical protein